MNLFSIHQTLVASLLLCLSGLSAASAYNLKGHAAIERRAYELIKQRPDGLLILNELHQ